MDHGAGTDLRANKISEESADEIYSTESWDGINYQVLVSHTLMLNYTLQKFKVTPYKNCKVKPYTIFKVLPYKHCMGTPKKL